MYCVLFPVPLRMVSSGLVVFWGISAIGSMTLIFLGPFCCALTDNSKPWAPLIYFGLFFHEFLHLLSIRVYLLIFWLLTQFPQICRLVLWAGNVLLPKNNCHSFCSFGDFIKSTFFPANLFKLLDKTNPNMKYEGILLLTLSHPSSLCLLHLSFVPNTKTVLRGFFNDKIFLSVS